MYYSPQIEHCDHCQQRYIQSDGNNHSKSCSFSKPLEFTKDTSISQLQTVQGIRIYEKLKSLVHQTESHTQKYYDIYSLSWADKHFVCEKEHPLQGEISIIQGSESEHFFTELYFHKHKECSLKLRSSFTQQPVLHIQRPFKLAKRKVKVFFANGELIGTVRKHFGLLHSNIQLMDANKKEIYSIKEPKSEDWHKVSILQEEKKVGFVKRRCGAEEYVNEVKNNLDSQVECSTSRIKTIDIVFPLHSNLTGRILVLSAAICLDMLCTENETYFYTPPP